MSTTLLHPYVTLNDVKFYCGIGTDKTAYDEDIKKAINKASRYIDSVTGRYYYKKSYSSEYITTTSVRYQGWQILDDKLFTPQNAPIITLTSLVVDDDTLTENTDFYVDYEAGMIEKNGSTWTTTLREIVFTGDLGYDSDDTETPSTDIPGDVSHYCLEIASRFSGHYKKTIKNYVSNAAEDVDLYGVPKDMEKALRSLRPMRLL